MKVETLRKRLAAGERILLDGAMGSELERRGIPAGLPLWSAEALLRTPETVRQIHEDFLQAGADILTTNTFRTTRRTFAKQGLGNQAASATALACALAREAIDRVQTDRETWLAGSLAPLEDCYSPHLTPSQAEVETEYTEQVALLRENGVDFLLLETMITLREALAGARAARHHALPCAVSFCCDENLALPGGSSLQEAARALEPLQPLFIGINCVSHAIATRAVERLRALTDLPISVYAQGAGLAAMAAGQDMVDERDIAAYIQAAQRWLTAGAQVIGGCCGTTPAFIRALHNLLHERSAAG